MTDKKLTADDARALLSDHIEDALDPEAKAEVDALLAADPQLENERARLATTLQLLNGLEDPEPPVNLVGKVRDRLAAERRAAAGPPHAGGMLPAMPHPSMMNAPRGRWGGFPAAVGLAAAAAVVVVVALVGPEWKSEGAGGTAAAGVAGGTEAVSTTIVAPGFPRWLVTEHAAKAGMDTVVGDTYEGDRRAAARFLLSMKDTAAKRGVEISGFLPDADRLRIEVRSEP